MKDEVAHRLDILIEDQMRNGHWDVNRKRQRWYWAYLLLVVLLVAASPVVSGLPNWANPVLAGTTQTSKRKITKPENLFDFLAPSQRNLATLIYSTVLLDTVSTRALGMAEFAEIIAKKYPKNAVDFYEIAFELSVEMPEKEYHPIDLPTQADESSFRDWQNMILKEMETRSRIRVQSFIVQSLVHVDPERAWLLFSRLQPPLTAVQKFSEEDDSRPALSRKYFYYSDPEDYYRAAFSVATGNLKHNPEQATEIIVRFVPRNDFSRFIFFADWIKRLREANSDECRFWVGEAFEDLKTVRLGTRTFLSDHLDQSLKGLRNLIVDTASNYPELISSMASSALIFSEKLQEFEKAMGQLETMPPSTLRLMRSHGWNRELLGELQRAVKTKDATLAETIDEKLKTFAGDRTPSSLEVFKPQDQMPHWPDHSPSLKFNASVDRNDLEKAEEHLHGIEEPQLKIEALILLAQKLFRDQRNAAESKLDEADELIDKIGSIQLEAGSIDQNRARARVRSAFSVLQASELIAPEKVFSRFKRFLEELDQVRAKGGGFFESDPDIQEYYLLALQRMSAENPDKALEIAKEMQNIRMRIKALLFIFSRITSSVPRNSSLPNPRPGNH